MQKHRKVHNKNQKHFLFQAWEKRVRGTKQDLETEREQHVPVPLEHNNPATHYFTHPTQPSTIYP